MENRKTGVPFLGTVRMTEEGRMRIEATAYFKEKRRAEEAEALEKASKKNNGRVLVWILLGVMIAAVVKFWL